MAYKSAWGEDRVYFYDENEQLVAMPASWTDATAADPFRVVAAGRALFRAEDLWELAELVQRLTLPGKAKCVK